MYGNGPFFTQLVEEVMFHEAKVVSFENFGDRKHVIEVKLGSSVFYFQGASTLMRSWYVCYSDKINMS
jgi:hypothetical protein